MNTITEVLHTLTQAALDESIQELIKDMKATQHGDQTNPLYDLLQDYHIEGGVWKHTKLALDALPEVAKGLADTLNDPSYQEVFDHNKNDLRAAALYHDIGKIGTQVPSKKRPGSYSFPQHAQEDIVRKLFDDYDITPNKAVVELVSHHHDSPTEVAKLDWSDDKIKMLMIIKAADSMAVGPRSAFSAIKHVLDFVNAMGAPSRETGLSTKGWGVEDIEWAPGSELGFVEPGALEVQLTLSGPLEKGFTNKMRALVTKNPAEVEEVISQDVINFLKAQTEAPKDVEDLDLKLLPKKSFEVVSTDNGSMEFNVFVGVGLE